MYKASRTADLVHCTNHALDFWIVSNAASDPGIRMISNGTSSLTPNEGLDRYKRQMGYSVMEQKHAIYFHPLLAPVLLSRIPAAFSRAAARHFTGNKDMFSLSRLMEGACMTREPVQTSPDAGCQQEDPHFSRLVRPGALFPILRVVQTFRQGGLGNTARRAADFIGRKVSKKRVVPGGGRSFSADETLGLQSGEWVEVKSAEEIRATLDARGKNRGLLFTEDMTPHIGKRLRVHKRVESIFLEESRQRRTIRNTVLLESSFCQGKNFNCDRSCFLFWKEIWLRRVSA